MSLLDKARKYSQKKRFGVPPPSYEELELALALLEDEISSSQFNHAYGGKGSGITTAFKILGKAVSSRSIEIKVNKLVFKEFNQSPIEAVTAPRKRGRPPKNKLQI